MNQAQLSKYNCIFDISHGVTEGSGIIYDDNTRVEESFSVVDDLRADAYAKWRAAKLVLQYIPNSSGFTTVTFTLHREDGTEIDQVALLRNTGAWDQKTLEAMIHAFYPNRRKVERVYFTTHAQAIEGHLRYLESLKKEERER